MTTGHESFEHLTARLPEIEDQRVRAIVEVLIENGEVLIDDFLYLWGGVDLDFPDDNPIELLVKIAKSIIDRLETAV